MSKLSREQKRGILEEYNVKTADDINTALKDMFGELLQEALEAELDTELGYAKGVSVRDIQNHLHQLYGVNVSPTPISNVTNRIIPVIRDWQSRPLQRVYMKPLGHASD